MFRLCNTIQNASVPLRPQKDLSRYRKCEPQFWLKELIRHQLNSYAQLKSDVFSNKSIFMERPLIQKNFRRSSVKLILAYLIKKVILAACGNLGPWEAANANPSW